MSKVRRWNCSLQTRCDSEGTASFRARLGNEFLVVGNEFLTVDEVLWGRNV